MKGAISSHNASYDVNLVNKNIFLEIKYSRLNNPVRKRKNNSRSLRWAWSKPFGESDQKVFDRLILIGEKGPKYHNLYKDIELECPYIFFDVGYDEIAPLTIRANGKAQHAIQLTTDPRTARSSASPLFKKYQLTLKDLEASYGI
ncbi:MAG: hypothetical protein WBN77_17310 [Desulfobacterales bacterium]